MARDKLTNILSETLCVTAEEAAAALEARDWDVMKAAELLQREQRAKRIDAARTPSPRGLLARLFGAV